MLITAVLGIATVRATQARQAAEAESDSLYADIDEQTAQLDELRTERDTLLEEVAGLEGQVLDLNEEVENLCKQNPDGCDEDEPEDFSFRRLDLDDALTEEPCRQFLNPGKGRWTTQASRLDGDQYQHGFGCLTNGPDVETLAYVEFVVPDGATRLTGQIGTHDNSAHTSAVIEFSVHAIPEHEEPLFLEELGYRQVRELDVPLDGVLRIRLQIRVVSVDRDGTSATAMWADPVFRQ